MITAKWEKVFNKIYFKALDKFSLQSLEMLFQLNEIFDITQKNTEPSKIILLRTLLNNLRIDENKLIDLCKRLSLFFIDNENYEQTIVEPIITNSKKYVFSRGITISNPTCNQNSFQLNIVTRFFDSAFKMALKIKTGIFHDHAYGYLIDTGFIIQRKHINNLFVNISNNDDLSTNKIAFGFKRAIANIEKKNDTLKAINGIDLTPAYFHIVPFSIFLGGQYIDENVFTIYKTELFKNIKYTFQRTDDNTEIFKTLKSLYLANKLKPLHISFMLNNKLILKRDSQTHYKWQPPRIIKSLSL